MKNPGYIPTLDGWRAVAIGLVLGAHSAPMLMDSGNPLAAKLGRLFDHAGYGVDIFFSLSGYLICTLLLKEKERLDGRIDLGRFYLRRAFRILPPLVVFLAALIILRSSGQLLQLTNIELVASLAFARNYSAGSWYTGHLWSLAIEEHFYLVIPLLLACLRWRPALFVAVCLSVASATWRMVEYRHGIVQAALPWTISQFRTENRFDGLMNGAILAILLHRPSIREWFSKVLTPSVAVGLMATTILGMIAFTSQPTRRTIAALALPMFIAFTVLRPKTFVGQLFELPSIRWIGRLSYSLYLWQELFLLSHVSPSPYPLGYLQNSYLSIVPTVGLAIMSYYLIEKPMIRMGHRLASSPLGPTPAPNPTHHPTSPGVRAPADGLSVHRPLSIDSIDRRGR